MEYKIYKLFDKLAWWFRYQATYYELKYYLKEVMRGKRTSYIIPTFNHNRATGKSVAIARLSAKYNIPVIVPTYVWKKLIEQEIPYKHPKYFRKNKPIALVENTSSLRGMKSDVILIDERLLSDPMEIAMDMSNGKIVGYDYMGT